jgi:hypothetical protein
VMDQIEQLSGLCLRTTQLKLQWRTLFYTHS